jgi:hypothetical protein
MALIPKAVHYAKKEHEMEMLGVLALVVIGLVLWFAVSCGALDAAASEAALAHEAEEEEFVNSMLSPDLAPGHPNNENDQ